MEIKKQLKNKVRGSSLYPITKKSYQFLDYSVKKIMNRIRGNSLILLYHRVNVLRSDPHNLCVSPNNFYNQLKFLKESYRLVPLDNLVRNLKNSRLDKREIAITFDDGYADNLFNALPILKELDIPATFFITAGIINDGSVFYWDQNKHGNEPLSKEELIRLAKSNLVEIGAHTISHPRLAKISLDQQQYEITESKRIIETAINRPVTGFAYPFGGKNTFTKDAVESAGYEYACGNEHVRVTNKSEVYNLPRHIVRNWDLNVFKKEFDRFI